MSVSPAILPLHAFPPLPGSHERRIQDGIFGARTNDVFNPSYPRWGKSRNTVTLVGKDKEFMDSLIPEVEQGVKGRRVQKEDEDDEPNKPDPDA